MRECIVVRLLFGSGCRDYCAFMREYLNLYGRICVVVFFLNVIFWNESIFQWKST